MSFVPNGFLISKIEEALETTKIHSVAGKIEKYTSLMTGRPFRSPHHTISDVVVSYYVVNKLD